MNKKILFTLILLLSFSSTVFANEFIDTTIQRFIPVLTQTREIGDIARPDFMPKEGHVYSKTIYQYSYSKFKHTDSRGKHPIYKENLLAEYLALGITDRFLAYIERQGSLWKKISGGLYHTKASHWFAGLGYDFLGMENDKLQGFVDYYQYKEQHVSMEKGYSLSLIYSHQFDWGLPYLYITRVSSLNLGSRNDPTYTIQPSFYKELTDNFSINLLLTHIRQISGDHNRNWSIGTNINYKFTDGIAIVGSTSYTLKEERRNTLPGNNIVNFNIDKGFTFGAEIHLGF